jgi:hypothetical protein
VTNQMPDSYFVGHITAEMEATQDLSEWELAE